MEPEEMKEIELKLTIDEINVIFDALGERPFREVYELIGKINDQADNQLKALGLEREEEITQQEQKDNE